MLHTYEKQFNGSAIEDSFVDLLSKIVFWQYLKHFYSSYVIVNTITNTRSKIEKSLYRKRLLQQHYNHLLAFPVSGLHETRLFTQSLQFCIPRHCNDALFPVVIPHFDNDRTGAVAAVVVLPLVVPAVVGGWLASVAALGNGSLFRGFYGLNSSSVSRGHGLLAEALHCVGNTWSYEIVVSANKYF